MHKIGKGSLWLAILVIVALTFTACGGKQGKAPSGSGGTSEPGKKVQTIKYGHNHPEDSPAHKGALAYKEIVESKTNGEIMVDLFPAMQLGSNRVQAESVQQGSVQMDWQPTAIFSTFVPVFEILDLPFLFQDEEAMFKVLDGPFGQSMLKKLEDKGFHGYGFVYTGFKQFTCNSPLIEAKDFKGKKMRAMHSPLLISQFEKWGANAVSIDFGELYNALQQNVVNGHENPIWTIAIQKYYEVQSDITETNHAPVLALVFGNQKWYESLTDEQRNIVDEAGQASVKADREYIGEIEKASWEAVHASSANVHKMEQDELDKLKAMAEPLYEEMRAKYPQEMGELEKAIAEASK